MNNSLSGPLAGARTAALWLAAVLVSGASLAAFAESYRSLYVWAITHDVSPGWAVAWPLLVDVFVAVGELALFIGFVDGWTTGGRVWPWVVSFGGLAVSVAGNVGHVQTHELSDRLTAAVPPIAAFISLTVGLTILKRVVAQTSNPAARVATLATLLADSEDARGAVAVLYEHGIEDTGTIAAITGINERTARRYRADARAAAETATGDDRPATARVRHATGQPRAHPPVLVPAAELIRRRGAPAPAASGAAL